MLVIQLAVLFRPHILLLGLRVKQESGQILKSLLYIDILLSTDIVNLLDMIILCELIHPLLFYLPLSRVYFIAEDEDIAMRTVMILQLLVPIRAEVLFIGRDTS